MKAVALIDLRKLQMIDIPEPVLHRDKEVLLQVRKVGVCGSDMHYFETGRIGPRVVPFPFILGHECAGTVVLAGRAVTRVRVGDNVAVDPAISCHACDQCRSGRKHTCRKLVFLGCPGEAPGCLSEYLVMPEDSLYPIGKELSLDMAVIVEPLSIGLYAVRRAMLGSADNIAILGSGPIGLCVLLAARSQGIGRTFVTDRIEPRCLMARRFGADWTGNPDHEDIVEAALGREPAGMDAVFECAGQQETLNQAVELLKPGGKLMILGIPRVPQIAFNIDPLRRKEITLINVRRQNQCVQPALDLLASGKVPAELMITHRADASQAQGIFELVAAYRDGVIKTLLEFS